MQKLHLRKKKEWMDGIYVMLTKKLHLRIFFVDDDDDDIYMKTWSTFFVVDDDDDMMIYENLVNFFCCNFVR